MAETIRQIEEAPEAYPEITGLIVNERPLDNIAQAERDAFVWQRIEDFTAWRWSARQVIWIVEGAGEWVPPLAPATVSTVEVWDGTAWAETVPLPSPLGGYELPGDGPYRVTASVGGGDVPAAVMQAARRMVEYLSVSSEDKRWATSMSHVDHGSSEAPGGEVRFERYATWIARALHLSGAADLLRKYRRAS